MEFAQGTSRLAPHDSIAVASVTAAAAAAAAVATSVPASAAASNSPWSCASRLLRSVESVHYLDAGLQCRGAHVTDAEVAKAIGALGTCAPCIHLHGTPRQWRDPTRRWVAVEKARSVETFAKAHVRVEEKEYFADEAPTLEMHFRCVDVFEMQCAHARR